MPTRCRKAGLTLIEVLLSTALLGMLLTALYAALQLTLRYSTKVRHASEIQQETLTVLNKVERALVFGSSAKSLVEPQPSGNDHLIFVSAEPDGPYYQANAGTGAPLYTRLVAFYLEPRGDYYALIRKDRKIVPPVPTPPDPPSVATLRNDTTLVPQVLTEHLTVFQVNYGRFTRLVLGLEAISPISTGSNRLLRDALTMQSGVILRQ